MIDRVLIDTGPMVALVSEDDHHHNRCVETLKSLQYPLFTCWPVVTEAAYLLRDRPKSQHQLFSSFQDGLFALLTLEADDIPPIAAILRRYEDVGLQLADATLTHLADREGIRTVFTTDRRDFSIIRLKRNRAFKLIPDNQ